jgi:glycopeptide antibiotics resistance protein
MKSNPSPAPTASHFLWLAHGLLLLTIYGSLIPLQFQPMPFEKALEEFQEIQVFDPAILEARGDWVINMVQYAVLSFCYMAALCVDRRRGVALTSAALVIPVGCAVAAALEFLQVYFPPRTVSVNDIAVESLGVFLGAAAWLLAGSRLTHWLRQFWGRKGLGALAVQALPAYLALLLIVHLMPFDVVRSRRELVEKYRQGRIQLVPFADLFSGGLEPMVKLLVNVLAFLPLGILLGLVPRCSRWGWREILRVGLGVTATIELLQLVVFTRFCVVTDILTGTAAVVLGWWLVRQVYLPSAANRRGYSRIRAVWEGLYGRASRWGPPPWVLIALTWAVVLLLVNWYPYDFTTDPVRFQNSDPELSDENTPVVGLRRMSWAPLVDYYWGSRYQALDQFVRRVVSFAPVGILLSAAWGRREPWGSAAMLLATLLLAALIETGQYFIPARHPSVTDLLLEVFGAWLGYQGARHVASALRPACTSALTV